MSKTTPGWCFSIDVGGTFTDCVARTPAGELRTLKVLSSAALKGNVDAAEGRGIRDPGLRRARDDIFRGFQLRLLDADGVERERAEVAGSLGADGSISTAEELRGLAAARTWELVSPEEAPPELIRPERPM